MCKQQRGIRSQQPLPLGTKQNRIFLLNCSQWSEDKGDPDHTARLLLTIHRTHLICRAKERRDKWHNPGFTLSLHH